MNARSATIHAKISASIRQDHTNAVAEEVTIYKPMDEAVQTSTNATRTDVDTIASTTMAVSNVIAILVTNFMKTERLAMTLMNALPTPIHVNISASIR
jgi:hypothetical protein